MVSKCANNECSATFHYLHDGKLFEIHVGDGERRTSDSKPPQRVERFWLCANCALTLTIAVDRDNNVLVLPRTKPTTRIAAAS